MKRKGLMALGVCLSACLAVSSAKAIDGGGSSDYTIYVFKGSSCGDWIDSSQKPAVRKVYLAWMSGFVSGINATGSGAPIENYPSDSTVSLYVDKYCRDHPLAHFNEGLAALIREIRP